VRANSAGTGEGDSTARDSTSGPQLLVAEESIYGKSPEYVTLRARNLSVMLAKILVGLPCITSHKDVN